MRDYVGSYAVVFTYNFDEEAEITLFKSFEAATKYLKESAEEEFRIETEENEWMSSLIHNDNWSYAEVQHDEDICEYRVTSSIWRLSDE